MTTMTADELPEWDTLWDYVVCSPYLPSNTFRIHKVNATLIEDGFEHEHIGWVGERCYVCRNYLSKATSYSGAVLTPSVGSGPLFKDYEAWGVG